jgi:hypothetical protein
MLNVIMLGVVKLSVVAPFNDILALFSIAGAGKLAPENVKVVWG